MKTKDFDLENELRLQARKITVDVPRGLSRTISAAIASHVAENTLASRSAWGWWAGVGGAVAAALVGAFVFRAPTAQVDTHAEAAALALDVQGGVQRVMASLQEPAAGEDPLHEEATALASAGQSALGFLAYNFLPANNG